MGAIKYTYLSLHPLSQWFPLEQLGWIQQDLEEVIVAALTAAKSNQYRYSIASPTALCWWNSANRGLCHSGS